MGEASTGFRILRRRIRRWRTYSRMLLLLSIAFLSVNALIALSNYFYGRQDSRDWSRERMHSMVYSINREIEVLYQALEDLANSMTTTLSEHNTSETEVIDVLEKIALNHDGYLTLGVVLEPYTIQSETRLFAPFVKQGVKGYERIDNYYDYMEVETSRADSNSESSLNSCKEDWYLKAKVLKDTWLISCYDSAIREQTIRVTTPLVIDDHIRGVAFLDISLHWLRLKVEEQSLGRNGYAVIYSQEGWLLYHGLKGLHEIIEGLSEEPVSNGEQTFVKETGINELTGNYAWFYTETLAKTGWTLHTVIDFSVDSGQGRAHSLNCTKRTGDSTLLEENLLISKQLWIVLIIGVVCVFTFYLANSVVHSRNFAVKRLWWYSAGFSSIFLFGTITVWICERKAPFEILEDSCVMSNRALVRSFKENYTIQSMRKGDTLPIYIPTGLFVQSVEFDNASNVKLTGYLWQKYNTETFDEIKIGVVFPESIDSEFEEDHHIKPIDQLISDADMHKGYVLKRWYFKTTLRERFDYRPFPFDRQSVWIRLWHKDFDRNVILVPDFESYDSLNPKALPGIEKDFVLSGWELKSSFYDIRMNRYNSNFGEPSYTTRDHLPELYFNVELRRRFRNSFISYLFPLAIMLLMLYAVLITVSASEPDKTVFGFSVTSVIASCSALFFVVLVAHVQLRNFLSSNDIVYLEHFYLATYLVILLIAVNAILFSWTTPIAWIRFRDNLIPKLCYWPCLAAALFAFTAFFFWSV